MILKMYNPIHPIHDIHAIHDIHDIRVHVFTRIRVHVIALLLLITTLPAFSQSLVTTNRQWHTDQYNFFPGSVSHLEVIRFTDDIIIEGKTYKTVVRSIDDGLTWGSSGYIREDTAKKVWFRYQVGDTESLMYDFNAQVNDSLAVISVVSFLETYYTMVLPYKVASIDSMLIGDHYRKRINLVDYEYHDTLEHWIDSTGSMSGILHNNFMLMDADIYDMRCYFENEQLLYGSNCTFVTGIPSPSSSADIRIFPNPGSDVITIDIPSSSGEKIVRFYDVTGGLVKEETISGVRKEISVRNLPQGLYFIRIGGVVGKIIVEKLLTF